MNQFSQRDPRWSSHKLGTSRLTIGSHGCAITCIAMMTDATPPSVNATLIKGGGYVAGNLVSWRRAGQLTGLDYDDKSDYYPRIAEVGGLAGFDQHFVVVVSPDTIIDPWDGQKKSWRSSGYTFRGWRHLRQPSQPTNEKPMTTQEAKIMIEAYAKERARTDAITDTKKQLHVDVEYWAKQYLATPAKRPVFDGLNGNIDDIMNQQGFTHYELENRVYQKAVVGIDCEYWKDKVVKDLEELIEGLRK